MASNLTFTMIKPGAVKKNAIGGIVKMMNDAGFVIKAMKFTKLSVEQAQGFYATHKGKPFFDKLIDFMTSGPIVAIALEKENAVEDFRKLIGATNPDKADDGTVRKLYATSMTQNAVHGSDSDENAVMECGYFFSEMERF